MKAQHKIGTQFIRRSSKRKDVETVVDILTTKNSKGKIVQIVYVAEHECLGQTVINRSVPSSTITLGLIKKGITK